jgi:WD40 repeat protein/DNA-binding XRE family transcriptional regulator
MQEETVPESSEPVPQDFGAAMRRLRNERGVSLSQLARATSYSKSHLSNVENGRKRPHRELAESVDTALSACGELTRHCPQPAAQPGQRAVPCPYRGLAAFGEREARWFFGRQRATATLVDRVARAARDGGPVVLVGASGAGKSSLLRAGLVHAVADGALGGGPWRTVVVTPGSRPADALARALAEPLALPVRDLAVGIRAGDPPPVGDRLLLVVDQLEELFTLCEDAAERAACLDVLCALPLAVLAVRADFVGSCLTHPGLVAALQQRTVALGAMNRSELTETVEEPASLAGLDLEPGLVDVLLHDLDPGGHGGDPGALPLLSHALLATWQHRVGKRLTVAGYRRTGGIRGAVAETAEHTYLDLPSEDRAAARRLMLQLVQVGEEGTDTRRRMPRAHLDADTAPVLEAFTQARLLTLSSELVEITHEALLRAWPRLAGWIESDREGIRTHQRISEAARAWAESGRRPDLLLQGAALAVAAQWAADHPGQARDIESEFLTAGAYEARRGLRRLRRAFAAIVGLMVLVLIAATAIFVLQHKAAGQNRRAMARAMAGHSTTLRSTDPAAAAALALASYRKDPAEEQARQAAISSSGLPHPVLFGPTGQAVQAVATHAGLLATGSREGVVRLWRQAERNNPPAQGRPSPLARLLLPGRRVVYSLALTHAGHGLVVVDSTEIRIWHLHGTRRPTPGPQLHASGNARDARLTHDGRTLAAACDDGVVRLWDLTDPQRPEAVGELPAEHRQLVSVSLSKDGSRIAAASSEGAAVIWNRRSDSTYRRADTEPFRTSVTEAALTPDGKRIAIGLDTGAMWLCGLDRRAVCTHRYAADHVGNYAAGLGYSADGDYLAEADSRGTLRLRDPATGDVLLSLPNPRPLQSLTWASDRPTLYTGSADGGTAHRWSLPLPVLLGHTDTISDIAIHDRRSLAASAAHDQTVRLWSIHDPHHPVPRGGPLRHPTAVTAVALHPGGTRLAAGTADGTVHLWDITGTPRRLDTDKRLDEAITSLAFAPDGTGLAAGSLDNRTALWQLPASSRRLSWQALFAAPGSTAVNSVAFALDGRLLATAESDRTVRLWNTHSRGTVRSPLRELSGHTASVSAVAADGALLATGGQDDTVLLWRLDPSHPYRRPTLLPRPLRGHSGHIVALHLTAGGRTLLSAGQDGTAALWNLTRPERPVLRDSLRSPGETFTSAALSADGTHAWTTAGTIGRHWTTHAPTATSRICATTGDPLTEQQWHGLLPDFAYVPTCEGHTTP